MTRRALANFLLATAALDAVAVVARAQTQPAGDPAAVSVPATDVPALRAALFDTQARPEQREQAAGRLLSRPDAPARRAVRDALVDVAHPTVQLAAARALAGASVNDPTLINPLFALLDGQAPETQLDAAARALSAFKNDPDVLTRLLGLAAGGDERVRVVVIRTVGTFPDKRSAAALVPLTDPTVQPPRVTVAASEALAYLTGFESTAGGWQKWWQDNQAKSETQFQADLAGSRASRYDRTRSDYGSLQDEVARMLADDYQRKPADQKADTLLRYMKSPDPGVRAIGCRIARQAAEQDLTPQPIKEQLRVLVGDASPDVRRRAAGALALINDKGAVVAILTQLGQETDSAVRAALADAVRPTRDVRAVPLLLALLDDPSPNTAQSAAEALGEYELGQKLRRENPELADRAADKLRATLAARTTPRNEIDFRNALVQAMKPLQSRALGLPLARMLSSRAEAPKVRRSLLDAIGELRDPQLADTVAESLGDPDASIRVAAVNALGKTGSLVFEKPLANLVDPAKETNADVRDAAWKVANGWFPQFPDTTLGDWERRLNDDPIKLLVVLREQRRREAAAGNAANAATRDQQIGEYCRKAGLWSDAIAAYTSALAYFQPANMNFQVEACSDGMATAMLRDRQIDKAVSFVQVQLASDSSLQDALGRTLKREAERLVYEAKDKDSALQLIDAALKIPQLKRQFVDPLQQLRAEVQRQSKEQNRMPYPPAEQAQNA